MVWFLLTACLTATNVPAMRATESIARPHIAFREGHRNGVRKLVLSPNGRILATGGADSTLKLWDAQTGELLHSMPVPGESVESLAFSPDSTMLVSGSSHREEGRTLSSHALLWDTATGQKRGTLGSGSGNDDPGPNIDAVAFSPDGTLIAVSTEQRASWSGGVEIWDARTGALRRQIAARPGYLQGLTFSPDGRTLAVSFQDSNAAAEDARAGIYVWDAGSGASKYTLSGHGLSVFSPAFSPDGSLLAGVAGDTVHMGRILLWDARTGAERPPLVRKNTWIRAIAFSPDSKTLASAQIEIRAVQPAGALSRVPARSAETVLWDLGVGQPARVLPGQDWQSPPAFSPDGSHLFTMNTVGGDGIDRPRRTVLSLWDRKTGGMLHTVAFADLFLDQAVLTPNGKTLILGGSQDGSVRWLDARTLKTRVVADGRADRLFPVAFSPDGSLLAWGGHPDEPALFWNLRSGRLERRLSRLTTGREWIESLAFTSDGSSLATLSSPSYFPDAPGELRLWDLRTGKSRYTLKKTQRQQFPMASPGPDGPLMKDVNVAALWNTFALKPDGKTLISGGRDTNARASAPSEQGNDSLAWWNAQSGMLRRSSTVNCGEVFASMISPNGALLATSGRFETILWNTVSGAPIHRIPTLYPGGAPAQPFQEAGIRTLAFSPDGKTLASGDTGVVRLLRTSDGSEIARMEGHTEPIHAVAFSPTGALLASAGADGAVRLWNSATHKAVRVLAHDCAVTSVAFAPNGHLLASGSVDGRLRFWRPETGALLLTVQVFRPRDRNGPISWIAYTPEGYYEGSADINEVLRWRVGARFFPAAQYERRYHRPHRIQAVSQRGFAFRAALPVLPYILHLYRITGRRGGCTLERIFHA